MRINLNKTNQQGFTLVEIAIVLVIIGLLLGAVFKGQELIGQAKIKNVVKKMDEVRAAAYTFLDKYNQLPGDAKGITGITNATTTANNGQIDNGDFWTQVHDAGLLDGSGSTAAKTPFGTNYYVGYNGAGFGDNTVCAYLPSDIAQQIDSKYDDGDGTKGSYRAATDSTGAPSTSTTSYSASGVTGSNVWLCTKL